MKLTIKDRLLIGNILPSKGDLVTLTIKHDLSEKIKITQEEIVEVELTTNEQGLSWNTEKEVEREFELTELEKKLVVDELKKLDEAKELTDDTVKLYRLFI
jgi:hypothetical protein